MPLTGPQIAKHWRHWGAVVESCDWTSVKGRLGPNAQRRRNESIWQKLVWKAAEQLAQQEHRAVAADDLRHACYLVATTKVPGWPASAQPVDSLSALGNRTFSRVLVLWALLIDPDDIGAGMHWDHPENSERDTLVASLTKAAPDATLRAIAANAYGTRDWENLDLGQLRNLRSIVARSQKRYAKPVREATANIDQPF